jgi:hypothetical protein
VKKMRVVCETNDFGHGLQLSVALFNEGEPHEPLWRNRALFNNAHSTKPDRVISELRNLADAIERNCLDVKTQPQLPESKL